MSEERQVRNAYRDPVSGAVIINDDEAYEQARNRKHIAERNTELSDTVSELRCELSDVHRTINELKLLLKDKS